MFVCSFCIFVSTWGIVYILCSPALLSITLPLYECVCVRVCVCVCVCVSACVRACACVCMYKYISCISLHRSIDRQMCVCLDSRCACMCIWVQLTSSLSCASFCLLLLSLSSLLHSSSTSGPGDTPCSRRSSHSSTCSSAAASVTLWHRSDSTLLAAMLG